jgi:hypothetical protein
MKHGLNLVVLVTLAGCTSMDVRPIAASANVDKVCIRFNEEVNVEDFLSVMQEDFFDHGITSVVFQDQKPSGCPFTLKYTVDRSWDFVPYMVDAMLTVSRDQTFIGMAHYHMAGSGGLSFVKWAGTHSKIDPVIDELLRNYPKVDMGRMEKTAAIK